MEPTVTLPEELLKSRQQPLPDSFIEHRSEGDLGAGFTMDNAVAAGFSQSLTVAPARAFTYWSYKYRSKDEVKNGLDNTNSNRWVDKDEFNKSYSLGGRIHFEDVMNGKMPRALAQALMEDHIDDAYNEANADSRRHSTASFAGGLLASFVSPVDLVVNAVLPEATVAKMGMGASAAARAGVQNAAKRFASRTINGAINAEVQNTMLIPAMAQMAEYNQTPFTLDDLRQQIIAAPIMGAAGGLLHATKAHVDEGTLRAMADAATHAAMSDKDPTLARKILASDMTSQEAIKVLNDYKKLILGKDKIDDVSFMSGDNPPADIRELTQLGFKDIGEARKALTIIDDQLRNAITDDEKAHFTKDRETVQAVIDRFEGKRVGTPDKMAELWARITNSDPQTAGKARKALIDDLLTSKDERIRAGRTDDERFLADCWQKLFGVDLNFIDPELADRMGVRGYISRADPSKAYIRAGTLDKGPDSMLFLAGHELGHAVRMRDPAMWKDMVNAMMTTAHDDTGELANTWAQVVKNRTGKGVWAGMDLSRKMDETFASVLGRAATSEAFWRNMYMKSPANAKKLTGAFIAVGNRLESYLNTVKHMTPETTALHEQLSEVLRKADSAGKTFSQKLTEDEHQWGKAVSLYDYHSQDFKAMMRRMAPELNERGLKAEADLAQFDTWADTLFPQVSEFTDHSGSPGQTDRLTTIFKNRTINSNNPAHWLMAAIFKKAKEGTPEKALFDEFSKKNLWWDSPKALAEYQRRNGSLIQFKKNTDGTWDIAIYKNDDFKFNRWKEVFDNMPNQLDTVTDTYVGEQLNAVRKAWDEFVGGAKKGEVRPETDEFSKYLDTLSHDELSEIVHSDPDVLWHGFVEHLEQKMADFRWEKDPEAYKNLADLRRRIDDLAKPHEGYAESPDAKALKEAWDNFAKEFKTTQKELQKKMERPPEELTTNTKEFFAQEFIKARQEILAELNDISLAHDVVSETRERAAFMLNSAKDGTKLSRELNAIIDAAAHDRLRRAYPQYDRIGKIDTVVKAAADDVMSISGTDRKDLPAGYRDGAELFGIENPMTDMSYDDLSFMAAEPGDINKDVSSKVLSMAQAKALTMKRMKDDLGRVRSWATYDIEAQQASYLKQKMDEHDITIDLFGAEKTEEKLKAGESPKKPSPIETALGEIRSKALMDVDLLNKYNRTGVVPTFKTPGGKQVVTKRVEGLISSYDYHLRQNARPEQALEQAIRDVRVDAQAKAISTILDHEVTQLWSNLVKQGLEHVASRLDSESRKRVKAAGVSVASMIEARRDADVAPLIQTILSNGLENEWKNGDETLARCLIRAVNGEEIDHAGIKRLAEVLGDIYTTQVARLNSSGCNIRLLPGYVAPQIHNPHAIRMNEPEFVRDLVSWVDWEKTRQIVGDNTPEGFDPELYAKQFVHEILNESKDSSIEFMKDPFADANTAMGYGRRRSIIFKDTFAYDYDMKYGSGNFLGLITEHIQKRSEAQVLRENFGSNWKEFKAGLLQDIDKTHGTKPAFMNKAKVIDLTIQQLVGELNHPEDTKIAAVGQAIRNYMNSVSLWMSGISSITDLGNVKGAFEWLGYDMKQFNKDLWGSIGDHIDKAPQDREILLAQGAGIHAYLTAFARTQTMDGPLFRLAQKASDFTFRFNGQEVSGRILQYAVHDLLQQQLGVMADKMTPEFENWLKHYDITADEWKQMSQHSAVIDGLIGKRLAPDMIPDQNLSMKLRRAVGDFVHHAIIEPSVSDKAVLTFGTKAGTKLGEALRCVMQYKGYPLAMVNRIQSRFSHAYGDQRVTRYGVEMNRGMAARLAWASSMIALATTAVAIKDVLRGREPINPMDTDQWTIENASRVITQAGVGPFAVAEQFLSPRQLLGPAPGIAWDLGANAVTANGYGMTNSMIGAAPGSSFAPLRESSKAILGAIFADSYGVHYQKFLRNLEREQGQTSIFLDKPSDSN